MISKMKHILTKLSCIAILLTAYSFLSSSYALASSDFIEKPSYDTLSQDNTSFDMHFSVSLKTYFASEDDNCPLERFISDNDTCWFCPIFKVLFNTSSLIALKAYTALAEGISIVVLVAFAIWVSICILKHVSAFEVKDPRKMLQEIMLQAFKVFIVVLILRASYFQVINLTLEPIFNTGMNFVQTISGSKGCSSSASYMQNIRGYDSNQGVTQSSSGGLPKSMGSNIICSIKATQDSVAKMYAFGRQSWCIAWGPGAFLSGFLPNPPFLITAIVIILGAFVLMFAFPWCLVDCVIQMSIASALAPAAIGAWAFEYTKKYLTTIWNFFMNAMFNFVFLSIVLYIIMTVVNQFMTALDNNAAKGWQLFLDPINGLAYWGVTGLKLVVVCLIGWVFLDEAKSFANKFATGASLGNIGRSVGATFGQAGTKVGGAAFKAGKAVGGAAMQVGDHFIGSKIRNAKNNFRINNVKSKGNAITDDDGNIVGYERTRRNIFGKKMTDRVSINADGKEVWSQEKFSRRTELGNFARGKINETRSNIMFNRDKNKDGTLIDAKDILDDDGNLIARETEHGKEYYDSEGNVTAREHYHRGLLGLGPKITTREEIGADGKKHYSRTKNSLRMELLSKVTKKGSVLNNFAQRNMVKKQRDLSFNNQSSQSISSDKFMSSRQIKDANGNVIQQDFAFTPLIEKELVDRDGGLNTQMLNTILKDSNFDKKTIMEAASLILLKSRGINISNKFASRDVSFDEQGNLMMRQKNFDGSVTEFNMSIGGENGNQVLTEVKNTATNGVFTIQKDNGIQKSFVSLDSKGNPKVEYSFSDHVLRNHKYMKALNRDGNFAFDINANAATFGFDQADYARHVTQVRTGKVQSWTPPAADNTSDSRTPTPPDGKEYDLNYTKNEYGGRTRTSSFIDHNGNKQESKYVFDDKNRLRETYWSNGKGDTNISTFEYDDKNRTSVEKQTFETRDGRTIYNTVVRQYDEHGNEIAKHDVEDERNNTKNDHQSAPSPHFDTSSPIDDRAVNADDYDNDNRDESKKNENKEDDKEVILTPQDKTSQNDVLEKLLDAEDNPLSAEEKEKLKENYIKNRNKISQKQDKLDKLRNELDELKHTMITKKDSMSKTELEDLKREIGLKFLQINEELMNLDFDIQTMDPPSENK